MESDSNYGDLTTTAMDKHARRGWAKFDPTVSTGALLQIAVLVFGMFAAYFALKEGQATQKLETDNLKANVAAENIRVTGALIEIKSDVRDVQRGINQLSIDIARSQADKTRK